MSECTGPVLSLRGVAKGFNGGTVVEHLDLDLTRGEFFSLLGPSGCGKTTTLRMIGGFEIPDAGRVIIEGIDVTFAPPHKRPTNTVFQSYALFNHMSIFDNVAFGLRERKVGSADIRRRVDDMLALVGMESRRNARPPELSGGQRQRVALARALVNHPVVLLLDEPLAALDQKLRKEMQIELKRIQREVGTTFVFVTHDQEEAMSMSDRIAVMGAGTIHQIGSAQELYERPSSSFVARFVGQSNLISVTGGGVEGYKFPDGTVVPYSRTLLDGPVGDSKTAAFVRPEHLQLCDGPGDPRYVMDGVAKFESYLGTSRQIVIETSNGLLTASVGTHQAPIPTGATVAVGWDALHASIIEVPVSAPGNRAAPNSSTAV